LVLKNKIMDNKTKILIGLGLVGVGGYLYWKSTQNKSFMSLTAKPKSYMVTCKDGKTYTLTPNSSYGADCTNHGGIISITS